jgi:Na+-transporting methylmalonyl-CoA/oxaloacetate decarboxylase gamma subunit
MKQKIINIILLFLGILIGVVIGMSQCTREIVDGKVSGIAHQ